MKQDLIIEALNGDKKALNLLIEAHQDMIYNLALKMLWHPEDAKDATQEILVKVVTRLDSFRGDSSFKTWVFSISSNHLVNYNKKYYTYKQNFEQYRSDLYESFSEGVSYGKNEAEKQLLVQEAKIGCSNAMLQCLNEQERITYILGEILELNSSECGLILDISPESFRKRLSRVRSTFHKFLDGTCGIVNKKNKCRCASKVDVAVNKKRINPDQLLFSDSVKGEGLIQYIDNLENAANLYRTNPEFESPEVIKEILHSI